MIAPIRSRGQRPDPGTWRNAFAELRRSGDNRTVFGGFNLAQLRGLEPARIVVTDAAGRVLTHETDPV